MFALALMTLLAGPYRPASASAHEAADGPAADVYAQVDTSSYLNDEDNVPIPPNLLEPEVKADTTRAPAKADTTRAKADTTRAQAAADTSGARKGTVIPANPAQPETLRYVPPTDKAIGAKPGSVPPAPNGHGSAALEPVPAKKPRGGIFGLGPAVVIAGLAVVHFMVIKAVTR